MRVVSGLAEHLSQPPAVIAAASLKNPLERLRGMTHDTSLSEDTAEQAIIERLFRASMDVECALSMVCEERTAALLRQVIDHLDFSIKHVQGRALDQRKRPQRIDLPAPDLPEAVARVRAHLTGAVRAVGPGSGGPRRAEGPWRYGSETAHHRCYGYGCEWT
jgi:hypothetical protein